MKKQILFVLCLLFTLSILSQQSETAVYQQEFAGFDCELLIPLDSKETKGYIVDSIVDQHYNRYIVYLTTNGKNESFLLEKISSEDFREWIFTIEDFRSFSYNPLNLEFQEGKLTLQCIKTKLNHADQEGKLEHDEYISFTFAPDGSIIE